LACSGVVFLVSPARSSPFSDCDPELTIAGDASHAITGYNLQSWQIDYREMPPLSETAKP
jgi:hypothetical protein